MTTSSLNAMLAVRSNTRIALATALIERNAECEALRTRLAMAQAEVELFARTAHNAIARNDGLDPVTGQPAIKSVAPRAQRTLPAHFAAAREAAMRFGHSVKVVAS